MGNLLISVLAAVSLAQDGLAAGAAASWIRRGADPPPALAWCLHGVVMAKWVAGIMLGIWAGYRILNSRAIGTGLSRVGQAVKVQRFSLVIVVLLGVIAVSRGSDVLEQMPDVERAWLTLRPSMGWVHLAAAVIAQLLLAFLLLGLGRMRVRRARAKFGEYGDSRSHGYVWPWLAAPAGLLAVTVILAKLHWAQVSPLGAVATGAVWTAARPVLRWIAGTLPRDSAAVPPAAPVAGASAGASGPAAPAGPQRWPWPGLGAGVLLLAGDVLLIFVPLWTTHWLGVLGTVVIALGTLTLGLALLAQRYRPPPVFRLMRLSSTPVISLIVVAGILGMVINRNSDLHDIRMPAVPAHAAPGRAPAATARVATAAPAGSWTAAAAAPATVTGSLQQWLASPLTSSCAVTSAAARLACPSWTPAGTPARPSPRSRDRTPWRPPSTGSCCGMRSPATPAWT